MSSNTGRSPRECRCCLQCPATSRQARAETAGTHNRTHQIPESDMATTCGTLTLCQCGCATNKGAKRQGSRLTAADDS